MSHHNEISCARSDYSEGKFIQAATDPLIMSANKTSEPAKSEQKVSQRNARNVKNGDRQTTDRYGGSNRLVTTGVSKSTGLYKQSALRV